MLGNRTGPIRWRFLLPLLLLVIAGSMLMAGAALAGRVGGPASGEQAQKVKPDGKLSVAGSGVAIPEQGTVTATLNVATSVTISDIDVINVTISHTFPGDLSVYLISPAGTTVALFQGVCGGTDWNAGNTGFTLSDGALRHIGDVCPPRTAIYSPKSALTAFNGQSSAGTWKLRIVDSRPEDSGVLLDWGLAFNGQATGPQPTLTPVHTATLVPTATPVLTAENFSDVQPSDFFYTGVRFLVAKGAISGYDDAAHCGSATPCYQPYANVTRGQFAKIAVLGLDIPLLGSPPILNQTPFADVPQNSPFYLYIATARTFNIVSGYDDAAHCGNNLPCFLPFQPITRGQLTKMVVVAAGWDLINPATPTFSDVPVGSPFYQEVETGACYGIISGYNDGTFKWQNSATRGQVAKILYAAFTATSESACAAAHPSN